MCNHPDLFEERPIISPHEMRPLLLTCAGFVTHALAVTPLDDTVHLDLFNLDLAAYCNLDSYDALPSPPHLPWCHVACPPLLTSLGHVS